MGTEIMLRPSEIRFTQDSISDEFGRDCGETLEQTFKELLYGEIDPEDIRPLTVFKYQNEYWVISGNKRLFIYRKLEDLGRVEELTVKLKKKNKYNKQRFFEMKTTQNEGESVRVRGKGNLEQRLKNIVTEWKRRGRPTSGLPDDHDADYEHYYTASMYPSGSLRSSIRLAAPNINTSGTASNLRTSTSATASNLRTSTSATASNLRTSTSAAASNLRTSTSATASNLRTNTGSITSTGLLRSSNQSTNPRTSTSATVGTPRTIIYQSSTAQPSIYRSGTYSSHDYLSSNYPSAYSSYANPSRSSSAYAMGDVPRATRAAQQPAAEEKKDESWCIIL